jgi:hypothetical protein
MDKLKLEHDSERHSLDSDVREQGASELFTFTEVKVNFLCGVMWQATV